MLQSEWPLKYISRTLALISATIVILIFVFLVRESAPTLLELGCTRFFTDNSWHPLSGQYNLVPMIVATCLTSVGAIAIATPLGIASSLFMHFYAWPASMIWHRRLLEILAGIPSVVFGLWGLVVLAPLIANLGGSGQNLLTATIVLGLMILPTVALLSDVAIAALPRESHYAAAALGLGRAAIIATVVLPGARRGIGVAVVLAFTRALGETMAVLMLAGNIVELPTSLLSPGRTLNANIALELGYASSGHRSVLFVSGLLMMFVVSAIVIGISWRGSHYNARK
ncbi:phosphate ABC transporter permease subunit PstC [Planctomycetaceae bacterium SH139]